MAKNRIPTNDYMISEIVSLRKKKGLTAQVLSNEIVGRPHWLSNIENRKVTSMFEEDALKLVAYLSDSEKEAQNRYEDWRLFGSDMRAQNAKGDYSYKNKKKELNRKLNKACKALHNILEQSYYMDKESIIKEEGSITTFIELMSSPEGIMRFQALFSIPLQHIDKRDFKKIISVAKSNAYAEYDVKGLEPDINGYLSETPELYVKIDDLFS